MWVLCLILFGTCAFYLHWKNRKYRKIVDKFPTKLRRVPFFEHAINLLGNSEVRMAVLNKLGEEAIYDYNGIVGARFGHKFVVVLADPFDTEVISKTCLEKENSVKVLCKLVGNGSIFAPVSIWRPRRKLVAPTFSQTTLNHFVKIFSKQSEIFADKLKDKVGIGNFSIFDKVTKYSMDFVCETVFGVKLDSQRKENQPIITAFQQFTDTSSYRIVRPWLHFDAVYRWHKDYPVYVSSANIMKNFVRQIVTSKRQEVYEKRKKNTVIRDQDEGIPKSLLEILIDTDNEKGLSDLELQEETLVLLVAGADSTSVSVSFTALLLAKYPDIQEKVYQEVIAVMGNEKRNIEKDDLPKLKYLEAVIKESLRLYPPVPMSVRTVDKDITLPSGETLVKGTFVVLHFWAINRNPKYWGSDAKQFIPERFLMPLKYPSSYIPFSSGPRGCLGFRYATMSMKTVLATMISRFIILPATGVDSKPGDDTCEENEPVKFEIMMKHAGDFKLRLELRN